MEVVVELSAVAAVLVVSRPEVELSSVVPSPVELELSLVTKSVVPDVVASSVESTFVVVGWADVDASVDADTLVVACSLVLDVLAS